jgi:hypothetical protein
LVARAFPEFRAQNPRPKFRIFHHFIRYDRNAVELALIAAAPIARLRGIQAGQKKIVVTFVRYSGRWQVSKHQAGPQAHH